MCGKETSKKKYYYKDYYMNCCTNNIFLNEMFGYDYFQTENPTINA